jgi:hypothetical protein
VVERKAGAAEQAVAVAQRHRGAEPIGEAIELGLRIGQLRLRRQRPAVADKEPLAGFSAEGIAHPFVAVGQTLQNSSAHARYLTTASTDAEELE